MPTSAKVIGGASPPTSAWSRRTSSGRSGRPSPCRCSAGRTRRHPPTRDRSGPSRTASLAEWAAEETRDRLTWRTSRAGLCRLEQGLSHRRLRTTSARAESAGHARDQLPERTYTPAMPRSAAGERLAFSVVASSAPGRARCTCCTASTAAGGTGRRWRATCASAAPDWQVVLLDLRLHGQSPAFAPPHTVRRAPGTCSRSSSRRSRPACRARALLRRQGRAGVRRADRRPPAAGLGDRLDPGGARAGGDGVGDALRSRGRCPPHFASRHERCRALEARGVRRPWPPGWRRTSRRRAVDSSGDWTSTRCRRCSTTSSGPICGTSSSTRRPAWTCTSKATESSAR